MCHINWFFYWNSLFWSCRCGDKSVNNRVAFQKSWDTHWDFCYCFVMFYYYVWSYLSIVYFVQNGTCVFILLRNLRFINCKFCNDIIQSSDYHKYYLSLPFRNLILNIWQSTLNVIDIKYILTGLLVKGIGILRFTNYFSSYFNQPQCKNNYSICAKRNCWIGKGIF